MIGPANPCDCGDVHYYTPELVNELIHAAASLADPLFRRFVSTDNARHVWDLREERVIAALNRMRGPASTSTGGAPTDESGAGAIGEVNAPSIAPPVDYTSMEAAAWKHGYEAARAADYPSRALVRSRIEAALDVLPGTGRDQADVVADAVMDLLPDSCERCIGIDHSRTSQSADGDA